MKSLSLIVLAAGASRRYGDDDKLLSPFRGEPLLSHVLRPLRQVSAHRHLAVVRPDASDVAELCRAAGFDTIENARADDGMAGSIATGIAAAADCDGAMIVLGDMPLIKRETISEVMNVWAEAPPNAIAAPTFNGRRGHPVIFSSGYFTELEKLDGDRGAGAVISKYNDALVAVPVDDPGICVDFDNAADFMTPGDDGN